MRIGNVNMSIIAAAFIWVVAKLTPGKQKFKEDKK